MTASSMGSVGMGASLAGGLVSAFGNIMSGNAQQQMYNYQAQVARINSTIDLQNAEYAINQGEQEAQITGLKGGQQRGAIIAGQGASGIAIGSGSSADVVASQSTINRMDMTQIRANASKTAYDFQVKSTMDTNQATLDVVAGNNAKTAGEIGAASSILGSVGSVASKWSAGTASGLFSSGGGIYGGNYSGTPGASNTGGLY